MNPQVTVLLPVRDAAATLSEALDSLWAQTWTGFTVLAVDDGSTDASAAILARHAEREPRLRVLRNRGAGLVAALETARAEAGTPYLARFDADDRCHPDRFRLQIPYLEQNPHVAAVGSRVTLFPRERVGPGWTRYAAWLNGVLTVEDHARERFVESPLAHPSVTMRAGAVEAAGGYRDPKWAEDYDLWLRLLEAGWGLAKVDRVLLAWRHSEDRLSVRSERYAPDAFLAARAHYLARWLRADGLDRTALWGAGPTGRKLQRMLAGDGVSVTRFYEVDPAKIGGERNGIPVVSWKELEPAGTTRLIVAVGAPGARERIRPEVRAKGYREGVDAFLAG
jgi:glycosyltransferase involved in cell wall biosynthesis